MIKFIVKGDPKSKQRPIFSSKGGKVRVFTGKSTSYYENLIKMHAQQHIKQPLDGAVGILITFYLHRPKYMMWKTKPMPAVYCAKRPDIDNLVKSVVDGLNGVAFNDDAQIVHMHAKKMYHSGNEGARTEISIWEDES